MPCYEDSFYCAILKWARNNFENRYLGQVWLYLLSIIKDRQKCDMFISSNDYNENQSEIYKMIYALNVNMEESKVLFIC